MHALRDSSRSYWGQKLGGTLLLISVSAVGFLYIDAHNAALGATITALRLETHADALIPFQPAFVFAYLLYYPWLLLPLAVLREREVFFRALAAFALMQVCAALTFVWLPSHMLRPSVVPAGVAGDLVRFIYRLDMGWNVFPSLHVGHSTLVALLCWRQGHKSFPLVALGSALISVSTVLIKQHYAVDIPAGLLLAWFCYRMSALALPSWSELRERLERGQDRVAVVVRATASRRPGSRNDSLR